MDMVPGPNTYRKRDTMTTRFTISRASLWDHDMQPHKSATREKMTRHSYYTFKTVAAAKKRYPLLEFEKVSGGVRTLGHQVDAWIIDFDSLDDLMKFWADVGSVVIDTDTHDHQQPHITIYDDYLE
jgi:hypothetical protein